MTYFSFLKKKIVKNKLNYIPMIIIFIIISIILILNNEAIKGIGLAHMTDVNIEETSKYNQQLIKSVHADDLDFNLKSELEDIIKKNDIRLSNFNELKKYISSKEWDKVYDLYLENLIIDQKAFLNNKEDTPKEILTSIDKDINYFKYLSDNNIDYEELYFPIKGVSFSISIFTYIIPIGVIISSIFILVFLFSEPYFNKINTNNIYPFSNLKIINTNLLISLIISCIILILYLSFSFILSSFVFGIGTFRFPIYSYNLLNKSFFFQPISKILLPSLLLFFLSTIVCLEITYIICSIAKNKMASLFLSLLTIISPILLVKIVVPIQQIAHLLPTSYLESISIVTGQQAFEFQNINMTFSNGILCTIIYILVLYVGIIISNNIKSLLL